MTTSEDRGATNPKTRLLTLARHLFATQGFQATTTRQLNLGSRESPGLLYYYFPGGKRAVLDAIIAAGADWPPLPVWRLGRPADAAAFEARLLAGMAEWWQVLATPAVAETLLILIRERPLLTAAQVSWCREREAQAASGVAQALAAMRGPLAVSEAEAAALAPVIRGLYQKTVLEELLIAGRPHGVIDLAAAVQPGLHLLTTRMGRAAAVPTR
ncbi:TetR/AcrR family transcriptional regulator [Lacticaseibacillus suihuaensis]